MIRTIFRILAAAAFSTVGVLHFTHEHVFVSIMPPIVPVSLHVPAVLISGVAEILGGLGLLVPATRRAAGWGLLALLVAVFPANLHMAIHGTSLGDLPANPVANWIRLPFQFVFAAWIWWVAELGRRGTQRRSNEEPGSTATR
jgi:uncharacterized membrane protein